MSSIPKFTVPYMKIVTDEIEQIDWTNKVNYAGWLAQTYYHICHSTRVLVAAAARFQVDQDQHHLQCVGHAKEEKSHEKIVLKDLKNLGFSMSDFPEFTSTKALYRNIYYLIEHEDPISIYGYVYFLELLSIRGGIGMLNQVKECFGPNTSGHLQLHSADDVEHLAAYAKLLDACSEPQKSLICEAVVDTALLYKEMLLEIKEFTKNKKLNRAA